MIVVSIQSKKVIEQLVRNGKYTVNNDAPINDIAAKPYKFMMKHYGYKHRPIFMCPVGYKANFGCFCDVGSSALLIMNIPDRYCKIQDYYGWSDFIYFMDAPFEYKPFNGCKDVSSFGRYVLDMYKGGFGKNINTVYQVTTQFLLKSWIKGIKDIDSNFIDMYFNNGGKYVLKL